MALIYAAGGALWIGFSDSLLEFLLTDIHLLTWFQLIKGWLFVGLTAALLFAILRRQFRADEVLLKRIDGQRRKLRTLSQFRESVIDNASIWINVLDTQANVVVWNRAAEQISGYSREQAMTSPEIWKWLYPDPDYRARVTQKVTEILEQGTEVEEFETVIVARDGQHKSIAWNSRRFFGDEGEIVGSIAIGRDVTDRNRAEAALREREQQLATLLANLPGMAYRCHNDPQWTMAFVSSGSERLTGYRPEALIHNQQISYSQLIHPDDAERVWVDTQAALRAGRPFAHEYRLRTRTGDEIWVWEQGRAVAHGDDTMLEGIIMDITERKGLEHKLAALAMRDPLTGLWNRREFHSRLVDELERANRYDRPVGLLWLDVDDFKSVNDRYGHLAGDEVLRYIATRLDRSIRNTDYVARIGGEEFVVILPEVGLSEAVELADRLRCLIAETRIPLDGGDEVAVTVSVGVASYPEHGGTVDALCAAADQAMYYAKQTGRDQVRIAGEAVYDTE